MIDFLYMAWLGKPVWMWLAFHAVIFLLLAFDLGLLHRDKNREIGVKESLLLTAFYLGLGLIFGGWIWWHLGPQAGQEYLAGLVVEKSLSMDNVFVIAVIFGFLGIPRVNQHRVLLWGILAAVVLRGLMIGLGAALVHEAEWVLTLFAAFLIYAGAKMLVPGNHETDEGETAGRFAAWMRSRFRITTELHGQRFMVRLPDPQTGKMVRWFTPLALALVLVNGADVIFAVDSVPAIFAITTDTYVVYTSNIFAILGLRALYFALAAMVDRFAYLKTALALILIFIGAKIVVADTFGWVHIEPWVSLVVTVVLLAGGITYSLWRTRDAAHASVERPARG
ncbi:TerC family protein [Methylobacterium isbiliense]|uniref:Membrane-bound redox modulator Alx n=1 Tax=Methylobacterium isbiliense TaxID=315478 RepID=A0ABQ4SLB9_9HYPH|nr:TerC family protein [Methylobacterium isbiliense]MDN3622299.1 TerC family protein [Methylobacterium isbiliense]GJE03319.1 Putative membrane-bound redox modulator Alx [Methylobacterium isbiliense]